MRPPVDDRGIHALARELGRVARVPVRIYLTPDFIPELPGWRERSPLVFQEGRVEVHNFDLYSQALSKIERGFDQDLADELDATIELLVTRERDPNHPRANPIRDRDGFRALTPREFDELLVEYGPQMQPPDGEG
jgi:hypothetical protein